jgi:hypothetical protein
MAHHGRLSRDRVQDPRRCAAHARHPTPRGPRNSGLTLIPNRRFDPICRLGGGTAATRPFSDSCGHNEMPFGRGEFALSPVVRCWHSGRRSGSAFGRRDSDLTVERVTATVGAERFGGLANSWVAVRTLSRLLRSSTLTILLAFSRRLGDLGMARSPGSRARARRGF